MLKQILIDIDGVVADFVRPAHELMGVPCHYENVRWGFYDDHDVTAEDFWGLVEEAGHDFWATLPVLQPGLELVRFARRMRRYGLVKEIAFCSTLASTTGCHTGRLEWIDHHFGDEFPAVFTASKHLLADDLTLLFDDKVGNCRDFRAAGGRVRLHPQPWNDMGAACLTT